MGRTTAAHQAGAAGVSEIQSNFEKIDWAPVRNEGHDIGTDMLVAVRDDRLFDRGLIGVQAKAGPSWFKRPEMSASGDVVGWWFYEPGVAHFDEWVKHALPHLLVLHDLDDHVSYWVVVTPEAVERVGKGCRILVPSGQTIDRPHAQQMIDAIDARRRVRSLEGTTFDASAASWAPGARVRYALLAPRLVAPHRNRGHSKAPAAEEAVALIALGRLRDLRLFSERHDDVPDPEMSEEHRDWRWRLVAAMWRWVDSDDADGLRMTLSDAPDPPSRAASCALLAVALRLVEEYDEALSSVDALVAADDLPPVDHAWILTHRARLRLEVGDAEGAIDDAGRALKTLRPEETDPTASAIGASAAWVLFRSESDGARLRDTLAASDTAVAWWRSQLTAQALGHTTTRALRAWAEDPTERYVMEDVEEVNLFSAEVSADLAADHGAWRGQCALRCRIWTTRYADDVEMLDEALDGFRRSGDTDSLKVAARHIRWSGPIDALRRAVARIHEQSWTSSTLATNLEMLQIGGDLLPVEAATAAALLCVSLVGERDADLVVRLRPSFVVSLPALEALSSLLSRARAEAHDAAARLLLDAAVRDEAILEGALVKCVHQMNWSLVDSDRVRDIRALGESETTRVAAEILGAFSADGDDAASGELRARARAGDRHALGAHGDVSRLGTDEAEVQIADLTRRVKALMAQAAEGRLRVDGWDPVRELTLFNLWFPDVANWDPVLAALAHDRLGAQQKRGAGLLLIALSDRVPKGVKRPLAAMGPALRNGVQDVGFAGPYSVGALPVTLPLIAVSASEVETVRALAPLAGGSELERRDLASFLAIRDVPPLRGVLSGLLRDERVRVRAAAAHTVGRLVSREPDDPLLSELARTAAENSGTVLPLNLIAGLRSDEVQDRRLQAVFSRLEQHPAAEVAQAARRDR